MSTPGTNTMRELADSEGIEVDCLGGRLRSLSQSLVGPLAEAALGPMSFDRVVLGADDVTAEDGICEADHAQTRLKELLARRGNSVYVLADSSKLGRRPFHAWARLVLAWTLVTDDGPDPAQVQVQVQVQEFRDAGVGTQPVKNEYGTDFQSTRFIPLPPDSESPGRSDQGFPLVRVEIQTHS